MSRFIISFLALVLLLGVTAVLAPTVQAAPSLNAGQTAVSVPTQPQQAENSDTISLLPASLSQIFASLGLYIVTMFTMAIGTEILVDVFKLIIGLRSKPKAKETLAEYEAMLPGTLNSLGVGVAARANLQRQLISLKRLLEPAFTAQTVILSLQQEQFDQAFAALVAQNQTAKAIDLARDAVKGQIRTAVSHLRNHPSLRPLLSHKLLTDLETAIDNLANQTADLPPDELFRRSTALLNARLADPITTWAAARLDTLQQTTYHTAQRTYTLEILPLIKGLTLSPDLETALTQQFENFLDDLQHSQEADIMLESLNRFLREVEHQRDELAAIWRKLLSRLACWLEQRFPTLKLTRPRLDSTIHRPEEAVTKLLEIQRRDKKEDDARVQQLRLVSVLVAVILAYILQIDSADLLGGLFPAGANFLTMTLLVENARLLTWFTGLLGMPTHPLTAGIVLTGLAASAGSGFWHDQLTRLQTVKHGVETAYQAVRPLLEKSTGPNPT